MENRSHALMAGLFTLLLGVSAVLALWWFGGRHEATDEYLVLTTKNVTGLNVQAQVRYRGVRVGRVEAIDLDPADVSKTLIRIRIRDGIPVTQGTVAKLGYQGITGIAHVLLEETGKDSTLLVARDGRLAQIPMQDSLFQELADVGSESLRNAKELLANINQILSAENRQKISKTLNNLEMTTGNAQEVSAQLKRVLSAENIQRLNSTLARAEQTVGQAAPFFAEARGLVARLQKVSEKLDLALGEPASGESGALVPKLSELTAELSSSSRQLNRLLMLLEESPQSLIFGHQKAPGPGESGFDAPLNSKGQP
ncbi:MAG: MlaD family protein [Betaproteobacteria bacterium]